MAMLTAKEIVKLAVTTLDEKKATDICVLEIDKVTSLGDYFVIASGGSTTQVKALAREVEDKMAKLGMEPKRIEGESSASWILIDYYDVIIHIFNAETRDFYCLERLWADATQLDVAEIIAQQ